MGIWGSTDELIFVSGVRLLLSFSPRNVEDLHVIA